MTAPRPTLAVGAVVVDAQGRLLAVRRAAAPAAGRWTLPGGRVEPGETIPQAVRREVAEETGLDVEVGPLLGYVEVHDADHHYVILDHVATVRGGHLAAGDDAADATWMTRRELETAATTPGLVAFLDEHGVRLAP